MITRGGRNDGVKQTNQAKWQPLALAACSALLASYGSFAQASLLDFDSTPLSYNGQSLLDPNQDTLGFTEQGFQFSDNTNIFSASALGDSALSGGSVAFNDHWGDIEITRSNGGLFSFQGLAIKNWGDSSEGSFSIKAYNGTDLLLGEITQAVGSNWMSLSGNFSGVSRLVIGATNSGSANFMIDNVNVSPVPEAESWAMLLLGGPLMGWEARRQKNIRTFA